MFDFENVCMLGKVKTFFWNRRWLCGAHRWWRKEKTARFRGLFAIGRREASRSGDLRKARPRPRRMGLLLAISLSGFLQRLSCFVDNNSWFIQSSISCKQTKEWRLQSLFSLVSSDKSNQFVFLLCFFFWVVELGICDWFGDDNGFGLTWNDVVSCSSFMFIFFMKNIEWN